MRYFEIVKDEYRKNPDVEIKLPTRGTEHSAGYDFYSPVDVTIQPNEMAMIWTDIKAHMYYDNVLLIVPRSSMGNHPVILSNLVGVIDSDYYDNEKTGGNIGIKLYNLGATPYEIKAGDRIVQGIFTKYGKIKNDTTTTKRTGGWGSTNN